MVIFHSCKWNHQRVKLGHHHGMARITQRWSEHTIVVVVNLSIYLSFFLSYIYIYIAYIYIYTYLYMRIAYPHAYTHNHNQSHIETHKTHTIWLEAVTEANNHPFFCWFRLAVRWKSLLSKEPFQPLGLKVSKTDIIFIPFVWFGFVWK